MYATVGLCQPWNLVEHRRLVSCAALSFAQYLLFVMAVATGWLWRDTTLLKGVYGHLKSEEIKWSCRRQAAELIKAHGPKPEEVNLFSL